MATSVTLPGPSGDYVSSPDTAALDITGDLEIIAKLAAIDWTPASLGNLVTKYHNFGDNRSYRFYLAVDGRLVLEWSTDGTATGLLASVSTVATGAGDGSDLWVQVTLDVDDGSGGRDTKFYTSTDATDDYTAVSWTQLGSTVHVGSTTNIYAGTTQLELGSRQGGAEQYTGEIYRAVIRNGIGGTVVFDADFTDTWHNNILLTEKSSNAALVTCQGDAIRNPLIPRPMSKIAYNGGLAGPGGLAGLHGGLAA